MKKLFNAGICYNTHPVTNLQLSHRFKRNIALLLSLILLLCTMLFTGCKKQAVAEPEPEAQSISKQEMNKDMESFSGTNHTRLGLRTLLELLQARAATARYLNINNAIKDGYEDLVLPVENMGDHFMKKKIVDLVFNIRKPELLVYSKDEYGKFTLGAVEYAVPIELSPNAPPEGFTGSADVWERNEDFGLWLLHAWVWKHNPDGVFNPTNPLVHVHP